MTPVTPDAPESAGASPNPPPLRYAFTVLVNVSDPVTVGRTSEGVRRMVPILGGSVRGPGVRGRVLPGGADYQVVGPTTSHLEAKYVLEMEDGSRVYVDNRAIRVASLEDSAALARGESVDPARVYFRCAPRFTADVDGPWGWVTTRLFVGVGRRRPDSVEIDVFVVE